MTPAFQSTLADNPMTSLATDIHYYDVITIKHQSTKSYLHSHKERYPLRYDDGRVSSQGQQVTGYPFNDTNNHWIVLPGHEDSAEIEGPVRHKDIIKLRHVSTNTDLLTHDVASPYYPTNQEFTTVPLEESLGSRWNDTLFTVEIEDGKDDTVWRTRAGLFKLISVPYRVAMWTHTKLLPEWAFKQQEINGNKNILQAQNIWLVEDVIGLEDECTSTPLHNQKWLNTLARLKSEPKKMVRLPFILKYLELQRAMFYHNNALTASHPYASYPISWPFLLRGVSFWTKGDEIRQQIYFIGNPIGWWLAVGFLSVFTGILLADQLTRRRGLETIEERSTSPLSKLN
jgi:dolichyl-phosphate-mannose-protein mannosyltransferase